MPLGTKNLFEFKGHGKHKGLGRGGVLYQVITASGASGGVPASSPSLTLLPELDGTNDYYRLSAGSDDVGAVTSAFSYSVWFKPTNTSANINIFGYDSNQRAHTIEINLRRRFQQTPAINVVSPFGQDGLNGNWAHECFSVSAGNSSSISWVRDDVTVADTPLENSAGSTSFIGTITIGADFQANNKLTGPIGYFWMDKTYVNWHDTATRRKVIDADLTPASAGVIGASGDGVTGSPPLIYLGNDINSFEQNLGELPDFTINGAPTTAKTIPIANSAGTTVDS